MSLDTRWEDVDKLLTTTERTKDEKHQKAVREIAAQRFPFPTPEHPSYRTHVNTPQVTMGVQAGDDELAPDIVVVERLNTGETNLRMTTQVALVHEINEAEAKRTWARFSAIPDQAFYLYVPVGQGAAAKKICQRLKIRPAGFRTWRMTPRGLEVNEISEAPSPLAVLMPPLVRRLLATP
ncbi:MAG: hypothetical protein WEC75_10095 [Dehalococcoidia bacterium]